MEKSKRVVGYARVSTEAQDITRQVELITAYCTERNYHLIKIIQEKISGARKDRKSLNELLEVDDTVMLLPMSEFLAFVLLGVT